jgi:hypothetical protein
MRPPIYSLGMLFVLSSCSDPQTQTVVIESPVIMQSNTDTQSGLPKIDQEDPAKFQTATFALG